VIYHIGQQVGHYRLVRLLGVGSFAEVYLGEHLYLGSQAAIKVLHTHIAPSGIAQFQQEGQMLAKLIHPGIMRVLDFGIDGNNPYLIMDYAPGGTLRSRHPKGTGIPLPTVVEYVKQIGGALQYAHDRKLIHRDVKPENMLIGRNGEILLSDFGIALIAQSSHYQSAKDMAGTISYMAPEQIGSHPRPASDQYSLAIVVYEWLCGERPFRGSFTEIAVKQSLTQPPSLTQRLPSLPAIVEQVVHTALAKQPEMRFNSVRAFATALEQASQDTQTHSHKPRATSSPVALPRFPTPRERLALPSPRSTPPLESDLPEQGQAIKAVPSYETQPCISVTHLISNSYIDTPTRRTPPIVSLPPRAKPRRSIISIALIMTLIILLIGTGGYAIVRTHEEQVQAIAHAQATAKAVMTIQAVDHAQATSSAKYSIDAYNTYVARDGIMFGFNAQHTRANSHEHILSITNVSQLHPKWTATPEGAIYSSPEAVYGLVYVGCVDHKLYAFDASNGRQKWVASTGGAIYSSPAVANGLVYIGSNDGKLYAFDAFTGLLVWVAATDGWLESSPTVANNLVYVGSVDHKLYAFDASTGQQKWTATTGDAIISSPAVTNGLVYIGSRDHKLYAFNATTGQQKWAAPTNDRIEFSSPAVYNSIVYIGSADRNLYAFDATTGQQKWAATTGDAIFSSPAVANGTVYVGSNDGKLYAFDALTGLPIWVAATGDAILSSPMVANGLIFIGSGDGSGDHKLYAFDASYGQLKWAASTDGQINSSPAVANGTVYIGSTDHKLYAFWLG